ncbi:MAG: hypothetical protein AWU59_1952 [Methanolobus sp. T82-4]|jgi:PGF-pre-PGF domain-containing protein|nr:MAG: hypothetical protein AWU59_1952 [Methanolobus sp. T82-4]
MRTYKNKLPVIATCFLIAITFLILTYSAFPVSAQAVVSIYPSSPTVQTNQSFTVYVNIEPESPFVGAQTNIDFDSSLITAGAVTEGELFGGEQTLHIFNNGTIDNQSGTVSGLYAAVLGGNQVSDSGTFVEVEFISQDKTGYSDLGLSDLILSNSEGQAIPVSIETEGITVISAENEDTQEESSGASSGGGGGGGSDTSEDVENIDLKEVKSIYVLSDTNISYQFNEKNNPVTSISYHSLKTAGQITATIEVLKDISSTVTEMPAGKVYRHINIWVGKHGYATEENMGEISIGFSVPKEWMSDNEIKAEDIRLNRFSNGKWNDLQTSVVDENSDQVFFKSMTPGFSPFAITALEKSGSSVSTDENIPLDELSDTDEEVKGVELSEETEPEKETETSGQQLAQNSLLLLIASMFLLMIIRKE